MEKKLSKLSLHQETLKNLTATEKNANVSHHACTAASCNSVCGLPCTPVVGINK